MQIIQQALTRPTVRTITLAEHHDGILIHDLLRLFFRGDHGGGGGAGLGGEETAR